MRWNRIPRPALRPFVRAMWVSAEPSSPALCASREHVLPTGCLHVVFRLSDDPVRLFTDQDDVKGTSFGTCVVGGPRSSYYVKDASVPACSAGIQFEPGTAGLLFGTPAHHLAGSHFRLEDLWGPEAERTRYRLLEQSSPQHQLDLLESLLIARLPAVRGLHPAVAMGLSRLNGTASVGEVSSESGYSQRRFIQLFREAVGLTPKLYCRVQRFQTALAQLAADRRPCWVDVAIAAGYSDQAHFNREFLEFTGITPGEYRRISPLHRNHVPSAQSGF